MCFTEDLGTPECPDFQVSLVLRINFGHKVCKTGQLVSGRLQNASA